MTIHLQANREKIIMLHIGGRIRLCRTMAGVSQDALGRQLGITFQQVQKYESAMNRISADRLFLLAEKLGTDISYFYEGLSTAPGKDAPLMTRSNLEAMRSLQQLAPPIRSAIAHLLHALAPSS